MSKQEKRVQRTGRQRRPRSIQTGHERGTEEVTLVQLVNVVLRHWRMVLLLPPLLAFAVGVFSLTRVRTYTAGASFIPQGSGDPGNGIASLASRLGLSVVGAQTNSPQFYADLLVSREILEAAVQTHYAFPTDTGTASGTLTELFNVEGAGPIRLRRSFLELQRRLSIGTRVVTGVVELSVTARSPALAEQIIARLIELVNDFNLEWRQSQATAERRFIEGRLQEVRGELVQAEDALERFLEENRRFDNSPELAFEYDRLNRQVDMRQAIVTDLSTAYEQARIAEVRNTPVITLVERPVGSARPNARGTVLKVLLALILGLMLAVLIAFSREFLARTRARQTEDVGEFIALRNDMLRMLRHPLRRLRNEPAVRDEPAARNEPVG